MSVLRLDNTLLSTVALLGNKDSENVTSKIKNNISRISTLESKLDNSLRLYKSFLDFTERKITKKILRTFISHSFIPTESGSYFTLRIEGLLLDEKLRKSTESFKFSRFFNKILVRIETMGTLSTVPAFTTYSWSRDNSSNVQPDVDGISFKIPGDQITACRMFLFRRSTDKGKFKSPKFRYCEVSSKLRDLLPHLRADPSEDDVLLAVWQYITHRDLFGDKDHKFIKCDEKLKNLLQVDTVFVAHLRGKLSSHLLAEKPIVVDQLLDPANLRDSQSTNDNKPFSSASFCRNGSGRIVDLEVDLDLPHPASLPADLQQRRRRVMLRTAKLQGRLALIVRSLQVRADLALRAQQALTATDKAPTHNPSSLLRSPLACYTPLTVFESIVNRGPSESATVSEASQQRKKRLRGDPSPAPALPQWPLLQHLLAPSLPSEAGPKRIHSGLHVFGGFLDVGEGCVFASDEPWLQRHVTELAEEASQQPKTSALPETS